MRKKHIYIIGGTGFIGYHLIKKLLKNKIYKIKSVSSKRPTKHKKIKGVSYLICDITKKNEVKKIFKKKKIDYVVNLAGYIDHKNKIKTYNSHYLGCKNLANILLKTKIIRFIQLGSSVEYGFLKSPQKESYLLNIVKLKSTYGYAKLKATKLLMKYFKKYNFPALVLRLYIAYGPQQNTNRFIPEVINSCIKKKEFNCSQGNQKRDFIFIKDLVEIIIKCLETDNIQGKIFNVGTGKPQKIKKIIKLIIKKTSGGKAIFGKIKLRKDEPVNLYPDISRLKKYLNWKPRTSFENGLNKTINYYKNVKL